MAEQPKKPMGGAYGCWLAEHRAELQKEVAGKPITELSKLAGVRYKALSEEEKATYQKKYEVAKAKYEEDMKSFLEAGGEKKSTKRKVESGKRKKDPAAPKRPAGGAFGCYLAKHRNALMEEVKGQPITAVTKLASQKWSALGEDEKKVFQEEYEAKKAAYDEAMKSYVPLPRSEEDEKPAKKPRLSKEQKEAAKETKQAEKASAKEKKAAAAKEAKASKATTKAKTAKGKGAKKVEGPSIELTPAVASKAEKLGFTEQLMKLASRPDVISSGKSHAAMLKALEETKGLLHPAKRALLGA